MLRSIEVLIWQCYNKRACQETCKGFPGTLFTCATGFVTVQDQAVNADDLMCLANIHTMEEIDEKRKFQKRYEGWRAHWTGIFRGVVHLWHDGRCRRLKYLAGSPNLSD